MRAEERFDENRKAGHYSDRSVRRLCSVGSYAFNSG